MSHSLIDSASGSAAQAFDRSPRTITLFCGLGLVMSLCLISFGVNLGAAWF
jgi:hypothetical protein